MNAYIGPVYPNILTLGGGLEPDGSSSSGNELRIQTTLDYLESFASRIGIVVCSGAYSASAEEPANGAREGRIIADRILRRFPYETRGFDVEVEDASRTTVENLVNVARQGYFAGKIDAANPLGIVTVREQFWRAKPLAHKALAVDAAAIGNIRVQEQLSRGYRAAALGGAIATRLTLIGVEGGDLSRVERAGRRMDRALALARRSG